MCFVETMNDVLFLYLKIDAISYTIIIRYVWDLINMQNSKNCNLDNDIFIYLEYDIFGHNLDNFV